MSFADVDGDAIADFSVWIATGVDVAADDFQL